MSKEDFRGMEISFAPIWIDLKVKVKSVADIEYLLECLKDLEG